MTRRAAIWLGFGVTLVHDVEELATMGGFLAVHRERLPAFLRSMTAERFAVSVAVAALVALLVAWAGARSRPRGPWLVLAIALQVGMAVNAAQHAAFALWARGYAPGVVTGLALCLPYGAYLVRRAVREEWVAIRPLFLTAAAVIVLATPFLMAAHRLSMLLV